MEIRRGLLFGAMSMCIAGALLAAPLPQRPAQLASGTPIEVRLLSPIDSGEARDGDTFTATLMNPMTVEGRTLARNSQVTGRVIKAVSSGRLKTPAQLTLELTSLGGYGVRTEPVVLDGKSHASRNAALIGGGAALGAIIGAVAGGGKGAAIGAATGAGAGTVGAYITGKKEIRLPAETGLRFMAAAGPALVAAREPQVERYIPPARPREPHQQIVVYNSIPEQERIVINRWLRSNHRNLPPGLAKRDSLPPGLERKLRAGGTLPPGLQKRLDPFPADLSRQLTPLPSGYSRVFLSDRALLLDAGRRILDMFYLTY